MKIKKLAFGIFTVIILLSLSISFSACQPPAIPSYLNVVVTQEPIGGYNINKLTCTYTVTYTHPAGTLVNGEWMLNGVNKASPPEVIVLNVVWYNDKGSKYNEETLYFGTKDDHEQSGTFTTTWQTPSAGQVFDKTFWVRFSWSDADGKHEQESMKAVCQVR